MKFDSQMEAQIFWRLEENDLLRQRRLFPFYQVKIGKYILDFAWPEYKLALEYDGRVHSKQWHKDYVREMWFKNQGWVIYKLYKPARLWQIRLWDKNQGAYSDFDNALNAVIDDVLRTIPNKRVVSEPETVMQIMCKSLAN